ncbi:MAG: Zn-dependent hydrolase [Atribacterota bacterium]|nr:Zn-dependent hydrolase [Atribacterota bacterium]
MSANLDNIRNDIDKLAEFNATPANGLTRFSYTDEHQKVKEYISQEMKKAGLEIYEDAVGNLFGQRSGLDNSLPVVMVGSHFDSVKNGGIFDGTAGVVAGLEIARILHSKNIKTKYPIFIAALVEEEGGRFGSGLFGSRAMIGKVAQDDLSRYKDENGVSIAEAMQKFGLKPENLEKANNWKDKIKSFIELHIEQGPILENEKKDIGIVETIVGIAAYEVEITGRPDHAGTTPIDMRANALLLASAIVQYVDKLAIEAGEGTVATVGKLEVFPGAVNIVPGKVYFTFETRSRNEHKVEHIVNSVEGFLKEKCKNGLTYNIKKILLKKPTPLSPKIISTMEENAKRLNLNYKNMISGAGHDAMFIREIADTGMVFVPSKNGRSHCPEEWTDYEKIKIGTDLIYQTV